MLPSLRPFSIVSILDFWSLVSLESKLWYGATQTPSVDASNVWMPLLNWPFTAWVMAVFTASDRCFSALVSRQGSASGYDANWSTSTPTQATFFCSAASSAPLSVLPPAPKITSAWRSANSRPRALPQSGSLKSFGQLQAVWYTPSVVIFGLTYLAPFSYPTRYRSTGGMSRP